MDTLLAVFPNRKYSSLMLKAQAIGIKSKINRKRKGSLNKLAIDNADSFYWWGFITADGSISERNELAVSLHYQDRSHLEKLANIIGIQVKDYNPTVGNSLCKIAIQDTTFITKWKSSVNYTGIKTYNPIDLDKYLIKDLFIYFFIGLVDGDG